MKKFKEYNPKAVHVTACGNLKQSLIRGHKFQTAIWTFSDRVLETSKKLQSYLFQDFISFNTCKEGKKCHFLTSNKVKDLFLGC